MLSIFKNPRLITKFRKTHLPYFDYYLSFCAYKKIMPPKRKLTTSQAENGVATNEESPKKPKNAKIKAGAVKRTLRSKKEPDDSKPEKNETKAPEKVKVEKTKAAITKTAKAKPVKKEEKEMEIKESAKDVEMDESDDSVEAPVEKVKAAKKTKETKAAVTKKVVKKKKNEKKDNEENIAKEANEINDEEANDSGLSDEEEPPKKKKIEKTAAKEPPKKRGPKPKSNKKETEPEKPEKEVKSDVKVEPKKRGRKPKVQTDDNGVEKEEKIPEVKQKSGKETANTANPSATDWEKIDFSCNRQNNEGNEFNLKISSWNVGGLRACIAKGGLKFLDYEQPDIICLQETKCTDEKMPKEILEIADYKLYWCHSKKDGYAGVGLLSKVEPISVQYGIGMEEHDDEGRCLTAEYENFHVVCVYVPNAGKQLVTLPKRLKWNEDFKAFIEKLDKKKPVIICGDMNVAHNEIDLKNPKNNKRNAGFTQEERDGLTDFLGSGFIDSYRTLYPDKPDVYTFWTYMANARAKNVGWRLDYFLLSERIKDKICDNVVRSEVLGSDHCPITLFLNL